MLFSLYRYSVLRYQVSRIYLSGSPITALQSYNMTKLYGEYYKKYCFCLDNSNERVYCRANIAGIALCLITFCFSVFLGGLESMIALLPVATYVAWLSLCRKLITFAYKKVCISPVLATTLCVITPILLYFVISGLFTSLVWLNTHNHLGIATLNRLSEFI